MRNSHSPKNSMIHVEPNAKPDFIISLEDGTEYYVEIKSAPNNPKTVTHIAELHIRDMLEQLFFNRFDNPKCRFQCVFINDINNNSSSSTGKSGTLVRYVGNKKMVFFSGYQGIVCRYCFDNPLGEIDGYMLFDKFKEYKKNQKSEIWNQEYRRQVRRATEGVNKRLRNCYNLEEDVLIYSEVPVVYVNRKFLY